MMSCESDLIGQRGIILIDLGPYVERIPIKCRDETPEIQRIHELTEQTSDAFFLGRNEPGKKTASRLLLSALTKYLLSTTKGEMFAWTPAGETAVLGRTGTHPRNLQGPFGSAT